jgi:regulation of enolase protein 1 (concanavalin A-like superfamily)/GH43 family beta-xylosidase
VKALAATLGLLLPWAATGAPAEGFTNPLDVKVADPCILKVGETYYLYGTAARPADANEGMPVWSSSDLVNWQEHGQAFRRTDQTWGQQWFWGPDVKRVGDSFLMLYGAFRPVAGQVQGRICVARSGKPLGPFEDLRAPLFDWPGRGHAIDAFLFEDADGQAYLYFTDSHNGRNTIWVAALASDRLALSSEPRLVLQPDQPWEVQPINEGAFVWQHGNEYLMLFSINEFQRPEYAMALATATNPLGPWRKRTEGPVIRQAPGLRGPGCAGLIDSPDGRELWAYYHVHLEPNGYVRQLALSPAGFHPRAGGGEELRVGPPTTALLGLPAGAHAAQPSPGDAFAGGTLDRSLWSIVDEIPTAWRAVEGALVITAQDGDMWRDRADYRNLFLQPAPAGDFTASVRVSAPVSGNFEQAFLIAWQDHDHFVRLGSVFADGPRLSAAVEIDGTYEELLAPRTESASLVLRLTRRGDLWAFAAGDGTTWTPVGPPREARFLRPRVGLGAIAPGTKRPFEAAFRDFHLTAP